MTNDLSFVYYRNFRFDGFLFARCIGNDAIKVESIQYILRKVDSAGPKRLDARQVASPAPDGKIVNLGCPIKFRIDERAGTFTITPKVTWREVFGGGSQVFAPLSFDIQPGEATRGILDNVPLDNTGARRKREVDPTASNPKLPAAFELVDGALEGFAEINRHPAVGPLLVKFAEGGAERFAADLQPGSDSALVRLWPGLDGILTWHRYLQDTAVEDDALSTLRQYYCLEQPGSMFNDTFIALGRSVAALEYVELVELQPMAAKDPGTTPYRAVLSTLLTGIFSSRADAQPTPDFEKRQTYLDEPDAQAKGLNIRKAWAKRVKGKGVRVHLTDGRVNQHHEDLRDNPELRVIEVVPNEKDTFHGTASTGVLVASANGFGMTGICHEAALYLYNNRAENSADSLLRHVEAGDVVALNREVEDKLAPGTRLPTLHLEFWRELAAILVHRGAVVVCAAGNGHRSDNPKTGAVKGRGVDLATWRHFDGRQDVGAIIIGACESTSGLPTSWSNYQYPGRMLNAWGNHVATLGALPGGDLQDLSGVDRDYSDSYNGTSAATPMVAGALALIQSYAMEQHHLYLNGDQMHLLVMASGYQDAKFWGGDTLPMGGRPNVHEALVLLDRILGGGRFHQGRNEL